MKNYRIVKKDFPNGSRYEVQVQVWKTTPQSHGSDMHSKTLGEAKRHIEHLMHRSDSTGNENVVFKTEKTKKA